MHRGELSYTLFADASPGTRTGGGQLTRPWSIHSSRTTCPRVFSKTGHRHHQRKCMLFQAFITMAPDRTAQTVAHQPWGGTTACNLPWGQVQTSRHINTCNRRTVPTVEVFATHTTVALAMDIHLCRATIQDRIHPLEVSFIQWPFRHRFVLVAFHTPRLRIKTFSISSLITITFINNSSNIRMDPRTRMVLPSHMDRHTTPRNTFPRHTIKRSGEGSMGYKMCIIRLLTHSNPVTSPIMHPCQVRLPTMPLDQWDQIAERMDHGKRGQGAERGTEIVSIRMLHIRILPQEMEAASTEGEAVHQGCR
mmetsp:Transcript_10684/g.39929  ORF Transcript_10684/g.39929 Transcript_10684/m.39929 type:complete len:307 (-) Transcript_10684:2499-3419(-)